MGRRILADKVSGSRGPRRAAAPILGMAHSQGLVWAPDGDHIMDGLER